MRTLLALLLGLTLLAGCANLGEVREFAGESARLAGYTRITERYLASHERERAFLLGPARQAEAALHERRQAARESLLAVHRVAFRYMATLAQLAGEDSFRLDAPIDRIGANLQAFPDLGLDAATVDATTSLAKSLSNLVLSAAQERAVRKLVTEEGPKAQKVFEGMENIACLFGKSLENEKKTVLAMLSDGAQIEEMSRGSPLLVALALDRAREKQAEYAAAEADYAAAMQGLQAIVRGHRDLMDNIDRLSAADLRQRLAKYRDEIRTVSESLRKL
jgi:hypothetical protein